ncbi:MAG: hypothetical protein KA712_02290 [Myxococcales bacterium]|nr:hypothetical protein [Myxococcales bacterium]
MASADEGLKSEALIHALDEALAGRPARLEDLLARAGGLPGPMPNVRLAAAFGAELGDKPGTLAPLLDHLGAEDSADDSPRAFLPVAAAHGWAGRLRAGREVRPAWAALGQLAADVRPQVLVGVLDAVVSLAARPEQAAALLANAQAWADTEDREDRYAALALAVKAFGDTHVLENLHDDEGLFAFLSRTLEEMAEAPRSAERSWFRRSVLSSLPPTLAAVITQKGEAAQVWFAEECARAERPDVRETLSNALVRLRNVGQRGVVVDELRAALEASAKPLRHAARVRPGTGRGKGNRKIR